ncbi:hypothetical protein Asppvi_005673 [Aspergillus pseudoviridinutans]|uniref:FAD-binding PCMH-type domain-containing protein n=1 Tax=Aspergillus pseudoviridinutans TaxID=1517512 RepID=A0A9P3BEC8_9EURO|nr:uncharacterized protein Asppvi_005673 [Aspergillus pseudoviridinutans]GIJ86778.1 hypothetical protein Asppvi_005673 [Aspergillus pseudoviridinutans]
MQAVSAFATCLLASVGGNSSAVVLPSQANYPNAVSPYNFDYPVKPAAVVYPQNAQQVAAAVKCAADAGVKVQAKSGGHSYGNYGSTTGELSVNLQNLQQFSMDETTWTATLGAGHRLGSVTELMYNAGGRHAPHGLTFTVGLGGHATVGGLGVASRQLGMTLDFVEEAEVVLANSSIVRASKTQNTDLFFAVRGAASSVGIVTEFKIRTAPAPPSIIAYTYVWTAPDVASRAQVFKAWQAWIADPALPRELTPTLTVTPSVIVLAGTYFGTQAEFDAVNITGRFPAAPQSTSAQVWTNFLEVSRFLSKQVDGSGTASPAYFYAKSLFVPPQGIVPDDLADVMFEYLATAKNGTDLWALNFEALGGAVAEVSPTETAMVHRDASYVLFSYARTTGKVSNTTVGFLDGLNEVLKSASPSAYYGEYGGCVDPKEDNYEARYNYYGQNLRRLEQVKAAVDPKDVFHNQQSVRPRA